MLRIGYLFGRPYSSIAREPLKRENFGLHQCEDALCTLQMIRDRPTIAFLQPHRRGFDVRKLHDEMVPGRKFWRFFRYKFEQGIA